MKKIALIGSTGSIGTQVIKVVKNNSDKFTIISLSAGKNKQLFNKQVKELKPKIATLSTKLEKEDMIGGVDYYFGEDAYLNAIVEEADLVVVSLVGFTGLKAVIKAIKLKKDIALANKESLVVGGELVSKLAKENGADILPIDSEHSAVWQSLGLSKDKPFKKIILTCSGGAFRDYSKEELAMATSQKALLHPNWNMGAKITIDCATLVNKAFEVIEAKWLFNTSFDNIDVIVHRESIIHSMVEHIDGSVIAQLGYPSMELPISVALAFPNRLNNVEKSLDFAKLGKLTFEEVDNLRFPCLSLVINAGKKGGLYPACANGANEECVKLFLQNKISFNDIYKGIDGAINSLTNEKATCFEDYKRANDFGQSYVKKLFGE